MTDERRPIRQISGNLQKFQAAISELTSAVAGSARITGKPEVIGSSTGLVPRNALVLPGLATFRVVGNPGIIVTPQGSHDQ
jgi:hypothetical protein